jgi:hypothetical protein
VSETFLIVRRGRRDIVINVNRSSRKVLIILVRFQRNEFCGQIFEKHSNTKYDANLSSGGRVVPCGQTDTTMVIVIFRSFAKAPKAGER